MLQVLNTSEVLEINNCCKAKSEKKQVKKNKGIKPQVIIKIRKILNQYM